MEYEHLIVDFTPLLVPGVKFAVRCESEEEATEFVDAMIDQFPEKCEFWDKGEPMWWDDNYGEEGGRAYFPNVNDADIDGFTGEIERFTQGSVRYAEDHDFVMVQFSSLIVEEDLIEDSDMSIEELFGM